MCSRACMHACMHARASRFRAPAGPPTFSASSCSPGGHACGDGIGPAHAASAAASQGSAPSGTGRSSRTRCSIWFGCCPAADEALAAMGTRRNAKIPCKVRVQSSGGSARPCDSGTAWILSPSILQYVASCCLPLTNDDPAEGADQQLGVQLVQLDARHWYGRTASIINHVRPRGETLMRPQSGWPGWLRGRFTRHYTPHDDERWQAAIPETVLLVSGCLCPFSSSHKTKDTKQDRNQLSLHSCDYRSRACLLAAEQQPPTGSW